MSLFDELVEEVAQSIKWELVDKKSDNVAIIKNGSKIAKIAILDDSIISVETKDEHGYVSNRMFGNNKSATIDISNFIIERTCSKIK